MNKQQTVDFNTFFERCEENLLARALLGLRLVSQEDLKKTLAERAQLPAPNNKCKLGQLLIRKRLLQISDYTKAMMLVRKQALIMYQRGTGTFPKNNTGSVPQGVSIQRTGSAPRRNGTGSVRRSNETKSAAKQAGKAPINVRAPSRRARVVSTGTHPTGGASIPNDLDSKILQKEKPIDDSKTHYDPATLGQTPHQEVGSRFGSYDILHEVARGGMGIVYKARQLYLNRIVALKVLLSGGAASETEIQRFRREAEAAGSLQHPNIVSIYEIGETEGYHYFTMDFIEGDTLQTLMKKKSSRKKMIVILEKVARALHHAHLRKIIHRDIKPSNIIVSKEGEPKITDFGLAKKLETSGSILTESGAALGTPFYMSPEQTLGEKEIDGRADIYSMGVVLYEILTGRLPFNGTTLVELYHKIVEEDPEPPSKRNRKVDKDLEIICLKCMEKDPERRYQDCLELADDLKRYMEGDAISARRSSPIYRFVRKIRRHKHILTTSGGAVALVLAIIMALFFLTTHPMDQKLVEARGYLRHGRDLIKENKLDAALKLFEKAIQTYPSLKEAYIDKGDVYQAYRDYQRALAEYNRIFAIDIKYVPAYVRRGHAYMGLRDWSKAIEEFTKAIEYDPEYVEAYLGRGEAYKERGNVNQDSSDFERSIRDYEKAEELKRKQGVEPTKESGGD